MPTPCTVTGTLNLLSGGLIGQGKVLFQLTNIGTGNPIGVTGTAIIPALTYTTVTAVNGTFSIALWGNDNINPSNTLYSVTFFDSLGNSMGPVLYNITGASLNLNTAIAANTTSPPVLVGGPAIVGVPLAPQTITGQPLTLTPSAPLTVAQLNNVVYADQFAGADIGAKINAAYAALPITGGRILVAPPVSGAEYNFTTPIVCTTAGKYVLLEGVGSGGAQGVSTIGGGVILNYTPTSGTALTLDYVPTAQSPMSSAHGVRNLTIINNNVMTTGAFTGSATGILIGTTNAGTYGASMENVSVIGFPVGYINNNPLAVQIAWWNPQFFSNGIAFKIGSLTGFWIFGGQIAGNAQGIVAFNSSSSPEIDLYGTSFFSNGNPLIDFTALTGAANCSLECYGVHFEQNNSTAVHFISGVIDLYMSGGVMEDTTSGATHDWMISLSGNRAIIEGTRFFVGTGGTTLGSILVANSPVRGKLAGFVGSPGHIPVYVTGANAANITVEMLAGASTASPTQFSYESSIKTPTATLTAVAPTVAAAQVGLGSTTATTATTGANGAVPAQVAGYLIINVAGTAQKIPYYNT